MQSILLQGIMDVLSKELKDVNSKSKGALLVVS